MKKLCKQNSTQSSVFAPMMHALLSAAKALYERIDQSIYKLVGMILIMLPSMLTADDVLRPYNLPEGATPISRDIFSLHMFAFWICVGIGAVVFGIMLWSIIFHRKKPGREAAKFSHSLKLEVLWTVIPIIILVVLLVPAANSLVKIYDTSDAEIDIQITGYQWRWHYEYLGENVEFFSNLQTPEAQIANAETKSENYLLEVDNEIVVPINTKVRFLLTSADVLHAWWVPDLAVKKDAIPGFINEAWTMIDEPGVYRGQCSELCGTRHAFMPVVVRAVDQVTYDNWLEEQQEESAQLAALDEKTDWTREELIERGESVYAINCIACHQANGQGLAPVFPALDASALVLGPKEPQIEILLNGRSGTTMQAFGNLLSDADIAAVITYTRNAWSNQGQGVDKEVFPQDIVDYRNNQ